jgi:hypothetical protein
MNLTHLIRSAVFTIAICSNSPASTIIAATAGTGVTAQDYRDLAASYACVGKVAGTFYNGSGVVISDRWVLTAGHVSLFKNGGTFTVGGANYLIDSVITHPSFTLTGPTYDVGLLHISTTISGASPAEMLHFGSTLAVLGMEGVWVGHGLTGTGTTGAQSPLEFRAFTNMIDTLGGAYGLTNTAFVADFDNPDGTGNALGSVAKATPLEGCVTPGDSGGGVFVMVDGRARLVGINSFTGGFVPGTNSKYGSISGAANLEQFHDWISVQTGIVIVPEPGVLLLFATGAVLLVRRRRM